MKNRYVLSLIVSMAFFFFLFSARADLSGYAFTVASGTYSEISGGTVLGSGGVDDVTYTGQSIGFTFNFNGVNYTTISVNTNGFIWFGSTSFGTYVPNPISNSSTYTNSGVVSALGDDLKGDNSSGELRMQTIGSAPNRVCVIQWKNFRRYYQNNIYNFQIRLYETSNKIEIHYGSFSFTTSTWYTKEVGLRGVTNSDFNNLYIPTGGSWSNPQQGSSASDQCYLNNSQYPASGTIYRWQLPQNDAGVVGITSPVPPFSAGTYQVKALIKNFGTSTLTSVAVNWSVNGTQQTPVNWTGSLGTGQTAEVSLGNWTFASGTIYNFQIWTSNPNNTQDENTANDTYSAPMAPALCGTFTIGSSSNADFPTISDAVSLLQSAGISCTVTMNIEPGTYTEQIVLPEIPGTGPNARVIFKSQTGDPDDVIIQYSSSDYQQNYVILFDGADYINIEKVTIAPQNPTYSRCVEFRNGANHNVLDGNVLQGYGGSSSNYRALIYSYAYGGTQNEYNVFKNNTFNNGGYGIYWYGDYSNRSRGLVIENNVFNNFYYYGIYAYYNSDVTIKKNVLQTNSTSSFVYSCLFGYTDGFEFTQNKISGSRGGYALYMYQVNGSATNPAVVVNNFIQVGDPSYSYSAYGVYLYYCSNMNFYHNNINCASSSTSGRALYLGAYGSNLNIINNIFANTGNGYAIYAFGTGIGTMDFNDIYSASSSYYCYYNGSRTSLSAWQSATGWDDHSLDVDPQYTSTTDLHVSNPLLNGAGLYVGVTQDIDGNVRNQTAPDIGADEFTPPGLDATLRLISPTKPAPPGNNTVTVQISNIRTQAITSIRLQYSDGTTTVQQLFTGLNIPSEGSANLSFTQPYNLQTLVTLTVTILEVNGGSDDVSANNTDQVTLRPALIGHYSVGTASSDFASISDALTALDQGGIVGNVWFDVAAGTYSGGYILGPFVSSDPAYTVTIQAASGNANDVTISGSPCITLRNASNWVVNALRLQSTSSRNVVFEGTNENVVLQNCILDGGLTNTSTYNIYAYNAVLMDVTIQNNDIYGGYMGMYIYNSSTGAFNNVVIQNNVIRDFYYYGIYGGYLTNAQIQGNEIHRSNRTSVSSFYGIYLYRASDIDIIGNRFHTVSPTAGYYYTPAIYMYNYSNSGTNRIINNLFYNLNTLSTLYTIYLYNSTNTAVHTKIYHNTIALYDATTMTSSYSVGIYVYEYSAAGIVDVRNNIIGITRGGSGYNMCVWYNPSGSTFISDNNVLYANGSSGYNFPGVFMSTAYFYLSDYQAASGLDANSIAQDPMFVNPQNNDFRIPWNSPGAKFVAAPLTEVQTDIMGDPRSMQFPDCGAYISPPSLFLSGAKDFGNVGRETTHLLQLWNTSAKDPITVNQVQFSGDVGSFQMYLSGTNTPIPQNFTLPANGSQAIDVVFGIQGASLPGQNTLNFALYNSSPQGVYADQITGYYASLTAVDPDNGDLDLLDPNNVLDMGQREAGETQPLIRTFRISADQLPLNSPIEIYGTSFTGPDAALFRITSTVPSSISSDVFVTVEMQVAGVVPGKKEAQLIIQHSAANGPQSVIRLEGRIGSPILVAPTLVQTPPAAIGQVYGTFYENSASVPLTRGSVVDVEIYQVPVLTGAGASRFEFVSYNGKFFVRGMYDANGQVVPAGSLTDPNIWANPSPSNPIVVSDVQPWLLLIRLKQPSLSTQPGSYNAEFLLSDGSGTGVSNARKSLVVTVVGEILNDPTKLPVYPTQLNFGTVPVGLSFSRNLILRNQSGIAGTATLTITGNDFHFAGGGQSTVVSLPATNDPVVVQVFFSPTAAGLRAGQLNITGVINETVPLSGNGLAAQPDQIVFSVDGTVINVGDWVDFGQVPVGQIGSKTVVVENNSPAPITISQISRGGANPTQFGVNATLPITIMPNSTGSFEIQFIPTNTNPATKEAQIVVYNTTGPFYFNVRGTAFYGNSAPVLYFTPSQYNFGNQSGQYTFTLHNDGNSPVVVLTAITLGSNNFSVVNPPMNQTLGANSTMDITVAFDASSGPNGLRSGTLLAVVQGVTPYPTAVLRGRVGPTTQPAATPELLEQMEKAIQILSLNPTPISDGEASVTFALKGNTAPVSLVFHNLAGQRVLVSELGTFESGVHTVQLPVQKLPSGTYFLMLQSQGEYDKVPVVIQK